MNLTEGQALAIAYSLKPELKSKNHVFVDERSWGKSNYDYRLFFLDKIVHGYRADENTTGLYFSDAKSEIVDDKGLKVDITDYVNAYLTELGV